MGKWKFDPGDIVVANGKAPSDYRGRQANIVERDPGTTEYAVNFDGRTVYLNSWWLDPLYEAPKRQQD